jgi:hypothetical protein
MGKLAIIGTIEVQSGASMVMVRAQVGSKIISITGFQCIPGNQFPM